MIERLPLLPAAALPAQEDPATVSRYGAPLLEAIQARVVCLDAAQESDAVSATRSLVACLAEIALALQAADPARLRRQTGWWGRLLGHDVERQAQAETLSAQLRALLLQASRHAQTLREAEGLQRLQIQHAHAAADALQAWCDAAAPLLRELQGEAAQALSQRLHHLQRLAALQQVDAQQRALLLAQDEALSARFARIHDVLVPAWQQAVLVRAADARADHAAQAAALHAQIADEVAAAQARLR